ncbi:MAG TPA: transglycosylase SLT domain-containing protein [Bryobacteraceae bacterium]|nr:transglycosylase SLT domain-containing protein [Bryobacteraceae bacterium]
MRNCWVHSIRVRWFKSAALNHALAAAALALCCVWASAAPDPLADLKAGVEAYEAKHYPAAIGALGPLAKRLPQLADYAEWFLASAQFDAKEFARVPQTLEPVWKHTPASPLAGRAVLLAAKSDLQADDKAPGAKTEAAEAALNLLRTNYAMLPQPQGDLSVAAAFEATGDQVSAAIYDQRVLYGFPLSTEAAQAAEEIVHLHAALGADYPPPLAGSMLGRALKLIEAGQNARGRKELVDLVPQLAGADRDLARVRIGAADYNANQTVAAQRYLESLEIDSAQAAAERLYYLMACAQRLNNQEKAAEWLDRLGQLYPNSKWRLEALFAAGNHYLLQNQVDAYEPLYRACYESFPADPRAATCHWKVAFAHYLRRRGDASDLLRAHLRLFPASENASAALYFLGRSAEAAADLAAARAYFDEVARQYPNQYYAVLARERLAQTASGPAAGSGNAVPPVVRDYLKTIAFPERARTLNFTPNLAAAARIERARLLASIGLDDWAQGELRFAAQAEDQPHVMAMELARLNSSAKPDLGLRYIKRYASGYLFFPLESAPQDFWRLAFPLPYRQDLERFARDNQVDPFLIAGLIRQESEFDVKAVSPSNARGLTQILPSTGRELSRRLSIPTYTTARLFQPAVNLQIGTFYLKTLTGQVNGHTEAALAAYNAGLTRARAWLTWGEFREPAEFVEAVPFSETRNYIQIVMRNADVYRRVYGTNKQASVAP